MALHDTDRAEVGLPAVAADKDEAIAIVGEHQNDIDPVVAARAVRKTDLFLIPAMIIGCQRFVSHGYFRR